MPEGIKEVAAGGFGPLVALVLTSVMKVI